MSKHAKGVALSYLLIAVKVVVTLLFTPFLVRSLGIEGYGLYALVGAMAAYLYILDFGLNDSVLRFFVQHENDAGKRDRFLARMLGLYVAIGALVLLAAFGLSILVEPLFGAANTPEELLMLRQMVLLTGGSAAVLVGLNPFGALLSATESFVFLRSMEIAVTILSTVVTVLVLLYGGGPVEVVIVTSLSTVFLGLTRLVYAVMALRVRVRLSWPGYDLLGKVGGYAAPIFVSMLASQLFWRLDNIIIGATIGVTSIAIYSIGVTFNKYFMSFATSLSRVLTPEIIRQIDQGADASALTGLLIRVSRFQAMFLLLILTSLVVFGQRFLNLWLGPEFAPSYWVMLAILIPYTFELIGNVRNIILQVKGLYWQRSVITFAMAALNIPLTIWLLQVLGVLGAAISTGIALMLGYVLTALLLKLRVGIDIPRYCLETTKGIAPLAAILTILGLWVQHYLPSGWNALLLGGLAYGSIFCLAIYYFVANWEERVFINRFLLRIQGRGGRA